MALIFISYAHEDKAHLDTLTTWLRENLQAPNDIWYDRQIEGGSAWRDEITKALDEAYIVLVIVTKHSSQSVHCTAEWAYGLGQGIPVLPLIFDDVSAAEMPSLLTTKQFVPCTESIPDTLLDLIRPFRSTPPQIAAINRQIYDAIYPIHRQFFILGWLGDGFNSLNGGEPYQGILVQFAKDLIEIQYVLEKMLTEKTFAFNGKQYRYCWKLIDFLKEFARLPYKSEDHLRDHLFPQFETEWLPAFEYFEGDGYWSEWVHRYFERDLEDQHNRMQAFTEMIRAFPDFEGYEVDLLLHNAAADRKRQQAHTP